MPLWSFIGATRLRVKVESQGRVNLGIFLVSFPGAAVKYSNKCSLERKEIILAHS